MKVVGYIGSPIYFCYNRRDVTAEMPQERSATFEKLMKNPEVYNTMNGPSEFHVVGVIKNTLELSTITRLQLDEAKRQLDP